MATRNFQCARHSLVSVIGLTMVGSKENNFKVKLLRWHKHDILRLIFANTAFHKGTILLSF